MKLHRLFAFAIAVFALAGMLFSTANAQTAVVITKNATFALPFAANWNGTVLSPGNYTLSVTEISNAGVFSYRIEFSGAGKKHAILAFALPGQQVGNQAILVAENNGATFAIRALHLPKANVVLTFPASKPRECALAKTQELVAVPIQLALK